MGGRQVYRSDSAQDQRVKEHLVGGAPFVHDTVHSYVLKWE